MNRPDEINDAEKLVQSAKAVLESNATKLDEDPLAYATAQLTLALVLTQQTANRIEMLRYYKAEGIGAKAVLKRIESDLSIS